MDYEVGELLKGLVVSDRPSQRQSHPAGTLERGTLTLSLRAGRGTWQPEGPDGPGAVDRGVRRDVVAADGAGAADPRRTKARSIVVVDSQRPATRRCACTACARATARACPPLAVPAARDPRRCGSRSGRPGTYHYWATTMGAPVPFRELAGGVRRRSAGGAVVDRSGARHHRVGQPDAGAARRGDRAPTIQAKVFVGLQPARHVRDQRPVVAGDRAADLPASARRCAGA